MFNKIHLNKILLNLFILKRKTNVVTNLKLKTEKFNCLLNFIKVDGVK